MDCLSEPEVSQSEHTPLLEELLDAVKVVITHLGDVSEKYSLQLFTIVLRVSSSSCIQSINTNKVCREVVSLR